MHHLNSQQFIYRLATGETQDLLSGNYQFSTMHSGLSVHGGNFIAEQDLQLSRLTAPYISFHILLSGELDFAINQHRHHIKAETGKILLIACERESLFRRFLYKGQQTCKLSLKGVQHWLGNQPQTLAKLYMQNIRIWSLPNHIKTLAHSCLTQQQQDADFAERLVQEAAILQLLAALWRDYETQFPEQIASLNTKKDNPLFSEQLNAAFANGAHSVSALANALHISERTLQRRLQEQFHLSGRDWLRHKHMQYAIQALIKQRLSIGEISYQCGYRHSGAFIQAFKQHFGCTPAKVRRQSQEALQ